MNFTQSYLKLFYSACGRPTPYIDRNEQVNNSYWLVCLMQGVNLTSIFLLINAFAQFEGLSVTFFFGIFILPFILNYFVYLKMGHKKILEKIDELIKAGELTSKSYVVRYVILTIIFLALSGYMNNTTVQSFFR